MPGEEENCMVWLTEKTTIPLPAAEVWPLLRDPALVASCIPVWDVHIDDLIPSRTYRRVHYGEA
jgi:hypothetical protein